MNKLIFKISVLVFFALTSTAIMAQDAKFEVTPTAGYTFSSRATYPYADMDLRDEYSIGLSANFRVSRDMLVELMYHNVQTNLNAILYNGLSGRQYYEVPMSVEYYHVGGIRELGTDKVRPFTSFTLGLTRFHPLESTITATQESGNDAPTFNTKDVWSFSASLGAGARISFSQRLGMRLQGRLMLPMYFGGVGFYCGSGCGGGATFGVYFLQLDLSAGLIIGLGEY